MLFVTIPTACAHPELLRGIVEIAGVPRENIVLVATRPNLALPPGCTVLEDLDTPNIQRWWLLGIEHATTQGATAVAVMNDDLVIGRDTLARLHQDLEATGAAIASPSRPDIGPGLHRGRLVPYAPVLWGALWMLNVQTTLRPDPSFVWWYGDNDLDIRARRDFGGVVSVDVEFEHMHAGEGTAKSSALIEQTIRDRALFDERYRTLLTRSRQVERLPRPLARVISRAARLG